MKQNRLRHCQSLYLQSHSDDPVDWHPWDQHALQKAKEENKPIFLSVGYSACHWCHVMQQQCFKNEQIAQLLNAHFIPIKVDREELPEIDNFYMNYVIQTTGSGGWPLSVFLTPSLKPFFGGTYFPPFSNGRFIGFYDILNYIHNLWTKDHHKIEKQSSLVLETIRKHLTIPPASPSTTPIHSSIIQKAITQLQQSFDTQFAGWQDQPKFPPTLILQFLLNYTAITKDPQTQQLLEQTLYTMSLSGLFDHIQGGFHRYCVDHRWHIPHFEKMLYDNAQLAQIYLEAFYLTQNSFFRYIAEKTIQYILDELRHPDYSFLSSQDADSEHEEGKFYLWTYHEIQQHLHTHSESFCEFFGITKHGNASEYLHHAQPHPSHANVLDPLYNRQPPFDWDTLIPQYLSFQNDLQTLRAIRDRRVKPQKDNKSITAWNAMTLSALAKSAPLNNESSDTYLSVAIQIAEQIKQIYDQNHIIPHVLQNPNLHGLLDDYALLALSWLDLYEATLNPQWLHYATALSDDIIAKFYSHELKGFLRSIPDPLHPFIQSKPILDHQEPSGNASAIMLLLKIGHYTQQTNYLDIAHTILQAHIPWLENHPANFPAWMSTLLLIEYDPITCTLFPTGITHLRSILATNKTKVQYPFILYHQTNEPPTSTPNALCFYCYKNTCSPPVLSLEDIRTIQNLPFPPHS